MNALQGKAIKCSSGPEYVERHVEAKHQCVVCWWGEITLKEALSH